MPHPLNERFTGTQLRGGSLDDAFPGGAPTVEDIFRDFVDGVFGRDRALLMLNRLGVQNAVTLVNQWAQGGSINLPTADGPGDNGTAPSSAQVAVLANLAAQILSGQVGFLNEDSIIQQVRNIMQLPNTSEGTAQARATYDRLIRPELASQQLPGGTSFDATGNPIVPTAPEVRTDLASQLPVELQLDRDALFRRSGQSVFGDIGGPGSLGRGALGFLQREFQRQDPILGFGDIQGDIAAGTQGTPLGQRQEAFLRGRQGPIAAAATPQALQAGLRSVLASASAGPAGLTGFETVFNTGADDQALSAALVQFAPFIQNFNPALRAQAQSSVLDRLRAEQARDPTRFQNPFAAFAAHADGVLPSR